MLIVNADDFGVSRTSTEPTLAAFDAALISSASAMVWMHDSARAGRLARERGMPLGLHLNLTRSFDDEAAPSAARDLQRALVEQFDSASWWRDESAPTGDDAQIRQAVEDQLEAFRLQYGQPTHLDGHHHIHVHPEVIDCLPRDLPIRPVICPPAHLVARPTARERYLRKTFSGPDACISFAHVHPQLGGDGMQVLEFGRDRVLEIMVHPQFEAERAALHSGDWIEALSSYEVGSYRDLVSPAPE